MATPQGWSELEVGFDFATDEERAPLAQRMVSCFQGIDVSAHQFFVALAAGPVVDLESVYLLMANLYEGTSGVLVPCLARAIERAEDHRVASMLAGWLNVELGSGDFTQIDGVLLARLVAALSPWCDRAGDQTLLRAGKRLAREGALGRHSHAPAPNPNEVLGAVIAGDVFMQKIGIYLASEMRRQMLVAGEAMRWLTVRENRAASHARDASALAALLPAAGSGLAAAWRGALDQWDASWQLLDDVHELRESLRG